MVIEFCRNKCCPKVELRPNGNIMLGDINGPEGVSIWTKENFADFLKAAKAGAFDHLVDETPEVRCACGEKIATDCKPGDCYFDETNRFI